MGPPATVRPLLPAAFASGTLMPEAPCVIHVDLHDRYGSPPEVAGRDRICSRGRSAGFAVLQSHGRLTGERRDRLKVFIDMQDVQP